MFGDGKLCACKPISEADLASYIADSVVKPELANQVLPIGGPGKALTLAEQGEMLFRIVGRDPKFVKVPIQLMDGNVGFLGLLSKAFPALEVSVEFGKIRKILCCGEYACVGSKDGKV
jgi:divinyl chlorophyllide a 8-vinyl-reductase